MNMKRYLGWLLILALAACSNDPDPESEASRPDPNAPFAFELSGDTAVLSDTTLILTELERPAKENEQLAHISIRYPRVRQSAKTAVRDSINQSIQQLMLLNGAGEIAYPDLQTRMRDFIEEYKESQADFKALGMDFDAKWSCEIDIQPILNTPNLLTLRFFEANFTGGAHANYATRYLNFDMRTGRLLKLRDVLQPDFEAKLLPIAERRFKVAANIAPDTPIGDTPFEFEGGVFALPDNLAITRTGLRFAFNPYEIGSFASGAIEFEIPYVEILPLLNREVMR